MISSLIKFLHAIYICFPFTIIQQLYKEKKNLQYQISIFSPIHKFTLFSRSYIIFFLSTNISFNEPNISRGSESYPSYTPPISTNAP